MTTSDEHATGPLGSATSPPPGDDGADGMAGPVWPPEETEPDTHRDSTKRGMGRLLGRLRGRS